MIDTQTWLNELQIFKIQFQKIYKWRVVDDHQKAKLPKDNKEEASKSKPE
jgi:hypothetical protein